MGFGYFIRVVRVPAYLMIVLWFVYQPVLGFLPDTMGVAYWAHIGASCWAGRFRGSSRRGTEPDLGFG